MKGDPGHMPAAASPVVKTEPPTEAFTWLLRARRAAPRLPLNLALTVSRFMANPNAGSDALLCLADALDESAQMIALGGGQWDESLQFRRLADLPRQLAPLRAATGAGVVADAVDGS